MLLPPFLVLLLLGLVIILELNQYVRTQAIDELSRSANSSAAKLEREFALRQTVLKRTGEELFTIKSKYEAERQKLEQDQSACSAHIQIKKTYKNAPNDICRPFLAEFALQGTTQSAIQSAHAAEQQSLSTTQNERINERLSAYKQFFPETLAILVADDTGNIVSSALSEVFNGSLSVFLDDIKTSVKDPIDGHVVSTAGFRMGVFAYPIDGGSVLAAYDVTSDSFLRETWESTPIDRKKSLAVILDAGGEPIYPNVTVISSLEDLHTQIRTKKFETVSVDDIPNIAVGSEAGASKWLVVVASPRTTVLSPVRDAQLAAILVIGSLIVGFLWVGTVFIRRTIKSIMRLVTGSIIFANNNLAYRIKLNHADEEFMKLADTMNAMAERIAKAEKEIDEKNKEFISIATHELRTPLTAIIGNLSMAVEDFSKELGSKVRPLITQAAHDTERLKALVNDMLDLARFEGGRVEFVMEPQDIYALAKEAVDSQKINAEQSNIKLELQPSAVPKVMADQAKLKIILNNFISNAIKYNRADGSVKISFVVEGAMLVTSIADTGLGIPDEQQKHMFEKFFRVEHDDRKHIIGTGLGMYITKQYIEAMNGVLRFDSTHGKGTTFYFSLPLADTTKH